jgi:flagellar protein FliS
MNPPPEDTGEAMQAAHQTYRKMQTETASPAELIGMLYDALLRNLQRAETGLTAHDIEPAHHALMRAQDILLELISSLDVRAGGEAGDLARQMSPLYEYMYRRLLDASLRKDTVPVAEVHALLIPLRQAWTVALEQLATQAASGGVREGYRA